MADNIRRDVRICAALEVVQSEVPNERHVTRNISSSGMYLLTKQKPWKKDEVISLQIKHRFCDLTLQARVVHVQSNGVGLEFVDTSNEAQAQINMILEGLLADGAWIDDRRKNIRRQTQGPIVWRHNSTEVQSHLRDISTSGAYIESNQAPEIGTTVVLYIPGADGADVVGCEARVAHHSNDGFGVELATPSEEFQSALEKLVQNAEK